MSLSAICQICGNKELEWNINTITVNVGELRNWTMRACPKCITEIQAGIQTSVASCQKESR